MITLRMIAIAAALLLGTPLVIAALPNDGEPDVDGGELVNKNLEAAAWIVDVTLADVPPQLEGNDTMFRPEQLVEGHTVFLAVDIEVHLNQTNGSINVTGFVECSHAVDADGPMVNLLGLVTFPVINHIDRAGAQCRVGERVFATPDPFAETAATSAMVPTGIVIPFTTPSGEQGFAEEYSYTAVDVNDWGDAREETLYAYATPVFEPWIHTDGRPKSFLFPFPQERMEEMGVTHFEIMTQDDPRLKLA
jgi:hypothetical protein